MIRRALLLAALAAPVAAQQVLYEPLPPAGSAYLRIVNAMAEPLAIRPAAIGQATLGIEPAQRISPYVVPESVAERPVELVFVAGAAAGGITLQLEAGSFNTVIVAPDGQGLRAMPIVDQTQFNQTRARLAFYNATTGCAAASLALEPEGQVVFGDVPAGAARMRSVNPVTAQVRAGCGAQRGSDFALGAMQAGGQYSVWMIAPRGQPIGFITRDATTPWRR